jgi:adenylate kinase family enzyme
MRRVNVIGTSCAGKSTFARRLAAAAGVAYVELDALHWEPGWVEVADDVFRDRIAAATAGDGWVVDGNYAFARDVYWPRLDAVVWLDYSFALVLWRAVVRTARRLVKRETCCNGNREKFWRALSRESIVVWVIRTHARRRRELRALLPAVAARGVEVATMRTPAEAARWLRSRKGATP